MKGITLDAGALIGFDRRDRRALAIIVRAQQNETPIVIPAGVVGQAWRNGRTQARLAKLLSARGVEIESLDGRRAREAGQLCGATGTSDIIDASVVLCAKRRGHKIATSDPDDLRRLDPSISLEVL
jgi:predicted nucleic acid-binding protein